MPKPSRVRNWAMALSLPLAIVIGLAAPGTGRERFLHVLLTIALVIAGVGTMLLIEDIREGKPWPEIGLAIGYIVFGFAGAFSVVHDLANQFVPAMWVLPVALIGVLIGIRVVYPYGIGRQAPPK